MVSKFVCVQSLISVAAADWRRWLTKSHPALLLLNSNSLYTLSVFVVTEEQGKKWQGQIRESSFCIVTFTLKTTPKKDVLCVTIQIVILFDRKRSTGRWSVLHKRKGNSEHYFPYLKSYVGFPVEFSDSTIIFFIFYRQLSGTRHWQCVATAISSHIFSQILGCCSHIPHLCNSLLYPWT